MSKTEIYLNKFKKIAQNKFKWKLVTEKQKNSLLSNIKWNPDLLFKEDSKYIAIDANLSNTFPSEGAKEIIKAKKKNKNLEFYFFVPQDYNYDGIFSECFNSRFGLFKLDTGGVTLVLNPDAKDVYRRKYKKIKKKVEDESGHIPRKLLEYVSDLKRITYQRTLKEFASKYNKLRKMRRISQEEYILVDKTIRKIFNNKTFHG